MTIDKQAYYLNLCKILLKGEGVQYVGAEILGNSRNAELIFYRALIAYILRNFEGVGLADIGKILGGRTHATVINLLKYKERKQNKYLRAKYNVIIKEVSLKCTLLEQQIANYKNELLLKKEDV